MRLYLLRHAEALDGLDDALRPLSAKGKRSIEALAERLSSKSLLKPMPLWHSPLLRSLESAKLFKTAMGWKRAQLIACEGIAPDSKALMMATSLLKAPKDVMIVGHEPYLGRLASLLLTGDERALCTKIRKGALICLERRGSKTNEKTLGAWRLRWHLSPELFE